MTIKALEFQDGVRERVVGTVVTVITVPAIRNYCRFIHSDGSSRKFPYAGGFVSDLQADARHELMALDLERVQ